MDVNDVTKVASRKRINAETEKLREKVSREAAKIIKLKVAQDTAYWDLKEKLQQVESNHEKLQQNMVEVQMQHEALSGQYQEELRLRPDILNKVSSTREVCGVLQQYSERLRDTLSRCAADQAALGAAYQRSGQLLRELRAEQAAAAERSRAHVAGLHDKVQLLTDHQKQLVELYTSGKQQTEAQIGELRAELAAAVAQRDQLRAARDELSTALDQSKLVAGQKEQTIGDLRAELARLTQECSSHSKEATASLAARDLRIKELEEEIESLKTAIENQDQFAKSICEQKDELQEKIAVLEEEQLALLKTIGELKVEREEAAIVSQTLQNNNTRLTEEKQKLLQEVQDYVQAVTSLEDAMKNLQIEHTALKSEAEDVKCQLNTVAEQAKIKAVEVETLTALKTELEAAVAGLESAFKSYREASDEKTKKLTATIEAKDKELDSKASTINQLMSQLKASAEIRCKLEGALQKIKKEVDVERDAAKEKEKQTSDTIGKLEVVVREKDDELSKQMSMMLEMRNEKERLQDKIQSMQNTIDNIQKELTRPPPAAPRLQPELDDNAVMLTPSAKHTQLQPPSPPPSPPCRPPPKFTAPRAQDPDPSLYSLFSDSSMEGDCLDMSEVNRRFNALARGERLSPAPLAALRRRKSAGAASGGLRHKPRAPDAGNDNDNDSPISLSQVKNDLKNKERAFFKNKRLEYKPKRGK